MTARPLMENNPPPQPPARRPPAVWRPPDYPRPPAPLALAPTPAPAPVLAAAPALAPVLHALPGAVVHTVQLAHSVGALPAQYGLPSHAPLLAHAKQAGSPPGTPNHVAIRAGAEVGRGQPRLGVAHAGTREGGQSFTCVHCAERFRSRAERKLHIRTRHSKPFACNECTSSFSRKYDAEKHRLTVHRQQRPYACDLCDGSFGQKHHLVRHQKAVHAKDRDFSCDLCGADFARKEHLSNHVRSVHQKAKPFLCFLCDAEYCEKRGLRRHLESLHVVKQTRSNVLAAWQPNAKESIPELTDLLKL